MLAFALAKKQKERFPEWNWHVGITFNTHVALDMQFIDELASDRASFVGQWLANELQDTVGLFKTPNGYWTVNKHEIIFTKWETAYEEALLKFGDYDGFDKVHAHLSLKYKKTTLRVSPKNGETHKLVEVIEPERTRSA